MATPIHSREINEDKMNQFLGKVVGDFGASLSSSLAYIGQKLGLYRALATNGPLTPAELAEKTNTTERYVREWLVNQAAGGYVEYDSETERYTLSAEQAVALTDEQSPFFVGGGFFVVKAMGQAVERIESHFREGGGMLWGEHHPDLFIGTEKFFRPGYTAHLVSSWIPALDGVEEKMKAGAKVGDIGCGHGASTIIMARAYPNSEFWGCTANSLALDGPALGAVASEDQLKEVVLSGGFTQFRRATETPFNRVFEARK